MVNYKIGDIITFTYPDAKCHEGHEHQHDPYPQVLVLHNNWGGNVHGMNFNNLSQQEINYLTALVDPVFAEEIVKKDMRIRQELLRLTNLDVTNPLDFFNRFIKGFVRQYDSYRRYNPKKMINVRVVKNYDEANRTRRTESHQRINPGAPPTTSAHPSQNKHFSSFFSRYQQSMSRLKGK